ncbi:BQ5605_C024g09857 [Microbotryum silenes-dioicae]|uniref:BQ5605_C024g09857 protein n=1 Tax=Microbotryum silenes-dioicae TaxID=796604 RepID=A0A2X0N811_9BASI|nr:BQ5605_C024g09857 [Microbotryum silenes-dioicae]
MLISEGFQQTPYTLPPAWDSATPLKAVIRRLVPKQVYTKIDGDCKVFQERIAGEMTDLHGKLGEAKLTKYDQWGRRVDRLETSEGWRGLKRVAAEEGLVEIPMKREDGPYSRVHMFAKTYLFTPRGGVVGCPMAMTDGAQRAFTLFGTDQMKRDYLPLLASRNPDTAITAAQWMTERPGGSDVSLTETVAKPVSSSNATANGAEYIIDGFKWFSSATDGDMSLALARTSGEGSRGLSTFAIPMRNPDGTTNGIYIHRLKNKFGTKYLPTAELSINGAKAQLVGELGRGVSAIASMLNITRVHSAISCTTGLGHCLAIARAFAQVRHVGGKNGGLLLHNEMHTAALAQSELVHRALLQFCFNTALLLGKSEAGVNEKGPTHSESMRLRLLTPVIKTFAADLATSELTKCMEALGGQGYMVENEIGTFIADCNVERIWEGTTNTLALDVVRVIHGTKGKALAAFAEWAQSIFSQAPKKHASSIAELISDLELLGQAVALYQPAKISRAAVDPRIPRLILYLIGYIASSAHLFEQALWSASTREEQDNAELDAFAFDMWVHSGAARATSLSLRDMLEKSDEVRSGERKLEELLVYGHGGERVAKLQAKL